MKGLLVLIAQKTSHPRSARYNYRYFLPYAPEWGSSEFCEQRLRELLEFLKEAEIDAVQFFVNILPGTYYMPAHSAREQEHWAAWMREVVAPAVRNAGVSYQLNFQILLGASPWWLDMRDEYDWGFLVNQHGEESLGCACPIDPVFRDRMGEMLRLWASTEPDVMWIDDDFRMHNHGLANQELDFYCYCRTHLREFAARAGREYSREDLVAEVLKPGPPSELRDSWLDFLGDTMVESAGWVREQVQGVSPRTRLAQMTSLPDVHSAEGRDWKRFLSALCGDYPPITRPCSGIYTGTAVSLKYQAKTYRLMEQSIAVLEQTLGSGVVEYAPELENTRFTTWCKAVANTEYVLLLSQLLGCPEITLSMNDLDGSPIAEEPTTVPVLRDTKPRLRALADLNLRTWRPRGVTFISDPDSARKVQLEADAQMQDLGLVRHWEDIILQVGIPAWYASPAEAYRSGEVVVLEEYTAWCPSDEELTRILAGGVLLDAGAARVLQERGFGSHIGVKVGEKRSYAISSEEYPDGVLPGVRACRVPQRGSNWRDLAPTGATVASVFVDPKNRRHTGSTIYENGLGGRVAVYASIGDFMPNGTFGSHARLRWLHGILRRLSREEFSVLPVIPHHALTIVRDSEEGRLLALANLGIDVLKEVTFRTRILQPPDSMRVLQKSGDWWEIPCRHEPADAAGVLNITVPCSLNAFDWLALQIPT